MSKKQRTSTTESSVNLRDPTDEELKLRELLLGGVDVLQGILPRLVGQQQGAFDLLGEGTTFEADVQRAFSDLISPEEFANIQASDVRRSAEIGGMQDELFKNQFGLLTGGPSDEQRAGINLAADQAIAAGSSDINRLTGEAHEVNFQETAPGLGLRGGDTPIQDRAARIGAEGVRQKGQLVRDVRGQAAFQAPLALSSALTDQQRVAESVRQFQANLHQRGIANKLALGQQSAGLGLALGQPINVGGALQLERAPRFLETITTGEHVDSTANTISNASAAVFSSKEIKEDKRPMDEAETLELVRDLDVERWRYIGDDREHIGPYAEDFSEKFGVGDGKTISIIDAIGVGLAATKGLAKEVEDLKREMGLGLGKAA